MISKLNLDISRLQADIPDVYIFFKPKGSRLYRLKYDREDVVLVDALLDVIYNPVWNNRRMWMWRDWVFVHEADSRQVIDKFTTYEGAIDFVFVKVPE